MVLGRFRLDLLLETVHFPQSIYYYQLNQLDGSDKELKDEIQVIYNEHEGNFGYCQMNRGFVVNHKKVQHLMKVLSITLESVENSNILHIKERVL